ncbi:MAG: glycosyltransferase [Candidatus Micrarchaeota archaeon]|nr:glycosyltransferase [Candidatus Micrarchaeota archaeon]
MSKISLGIVSQTPVVRLLQKQEGDTIRLSDLSEREYAYTAGGVAPLVKAQLEQLEGMGALRKAIWFSLNPSAPKNIILSKVTRAVSIYLEDESSRDYVDFKEEVWKNIHNLNSRAFTIKEYLGYFRYNSKLGKLMLKDYEDINLFEIHDFQQMLLGAMLGPSFPTILRWHGPFVPEILNKKIRKFIINGLEGNDAVIVSTKRDLEGLIRGGYRGSAYQLYPHIDNRVWNRTSRNRLNAFSHRFNIKPDDFLVINVARMDPIKSQDDLIKAVAMAGNKRIKLMLIGGSSFTTNALGHSKGALWLDKLKKLARKLKIEDRVIFAGTLTHSDLECAYTRADLFALPSRMEGFGLAVVEGWLYDTPSIVSEGAGVSELVTEGFNGFTFRAGDTKSLAQKITRLFNGNGRLLSDMGTNAKNMAKACYVTTTIGTIKKIYWDTIESFG